jgi:hypothetical protein
MKFVTIVNFIRIVKLYLNRLDPIAFLPIVDNSGTLHDDFFRLLFLIHIVTRTSL